MTEKASTYKVVLGCIGKQARVKHEGKSRKQHNSKVTASVLDSKFLAWIPALTSFDDGQWGGSLRKTNPFFQKKKKCFLDQGVLPHQQKPQFKKTCMVERGEIVHNINQSERIILLSWGKLGFLFSVHLFFEPVPGVSVSLGVLVAFELTVKEILEFMYLPRKSRTWDRCKIDCYLFLKVLIKLQEHWEDFRWLVLPLLKEYKDSNDDRSNIHRKIKGGENNGWGTNSTYCPFRRPEVSSLHLYGLLTITYL